MLLEKRIPIRYLYNKVKVDLLFVIIVGLIIHVITTKYQRFLPEMPLSIPAFLGTAISILLSFKINQSYDRWWEARKIWGAIVNDSRSFVLQLQEFVRDNREAISRMAYRQIAWCYCLGKSLRGLNPVDNMDEFVSDDDIAAISAHSNKPLALIQLNTRELRQLEAEGSLDVFTHVQINSTLVRLVDSMGKAERINSTVFPVTYRLFLHFTIYLFVTLLSIALRDVESVFEIPLLALISLVFLLLEKTAYHLQDPFRNRPSDTSVTAIARTIEINIKQLLGEEDVPQPLTSNTFYIL